jgi:transporter family-2 protein
MYSVFLLMALVGGTALATQALINARLGTIVGGPVWAATISFFVGSCGLFLFQLLRGAPIPSTSSLSSPWWLWVGGLLGAYYVAAATFTVTKLGAATLVTLVILGQLLASLLLDHYGVLSETVRPITWQRGFGAALLFVGATLIVRG